MSFLRAIQKHLSLFIFLILLVVTTFFLRSYDATAEWVRSPAFCLMPHMLLILCFVLGACFHQTRVSFISMFLFVMMLLVSHAAFIRPDDRKLFSMIFLASVYYPLLVVIFYFMKEQGILSPQGYLKIAIVLSALVVLLLVPKIPSLTDVFTGKSGAGIARPVSTWFRIPALGLAVFLCCVPLLLIPRSHESSSTGPMLAMSAVYVLMGLNFGTSLWGDAAAHSASVLFNSGAGLVMIWLVLESAWRHANIDELTQLPGRRAFKMRMERLRKGYGLAVVDIDRFKKINDKYGHDTGDQVLRYVASQMRKSEAGHVYRYGGEEFVVVASSVEIKEFHELLDDLRESIASRPFGIRGLNRPKKKSKNVKTSGSGEKITVTVSIGAAVQGPKRSTPNEVLQEADKALYRAKKAGRNRVRAAR